MIKKLCSRRVDLVNLSIGDINWGLRVAELRGFMFLLCPMEMGGELKMIDR